MFTIKKLIVLCTAAALFGVLPSEAKTQTQTANKPNKPHKAGGYGVSTTTGWRKINGWQKDVTGRDPNLEHWNWSAMQEMNKAYVRLRPGQRDSRRSVYKKPVHATVTRPHVAHYMGGNGGAPSESRYSRPVNVPLPSRNVAAKLHAPSTNISLSAPRTRAVLAAPSTSVRLAAPETRAQLASTNTNIRLTAPPKKAAMPVISDAMSDCGSGFTADGFETPEAESNPYGPAPHHNYRHKSTASVKGKLVKKRK